MDKNLMDKYKYDDLYRELKDREHRYSHHLFELENRSSEEILEEIPIEDIEKYLRKKKLEKINENKI